MNYKLKYTGDQINNLLDKVNDMDPESYVTKEEGKGLSTNDFTDPLKNKLESLNVMIKVTWSELVSLRNNAQLIPGCFYRITDYECTTTQMDTSSAGHPFDIIVLALTNNTLSEEARACLHSPDDIYFQEAVQKIISASWNKGVKLEDVEILAFIDETGEVAYGQELPGTSPGGSLHGSAGVITRLTTFKNADGLDVPAMLNPSPDGDVTYDCYYVYAGTFTIDGEVYDEWQEYGVASAGFRDVYYLTQNLVTATLSKIYIPKCNMDAWRLKYSLDNDRFRFVWAHSMSINLEQNERYYRKPKYDENGHWAWGYLENETDIAYTDPNPVVGGTLYEGTYSSTSNTNEDRIIDVDSSEGKGVIYYMRDEYGNECPYDFKNIIFTDKDSPRFTFNSERADATVRLSVTYNNIIKECHTSEGFQLPFNTITNIHSKNIIGNVFGLNSFNNTITDYNGVGCSYNVLKNDCANNIISGSSNILGNNCNSNNISVNSNHNVFANDCNNNQLLANVSYTHIGRGSNHNIVAGDNNTIGNNCQGNDINDISNILADNCQNIKISTNGASKSSGYNYFGYGCNNITLFFECNYNYFKSGCNNITLDLRCGYNHFGNGCNNITLDRRCSYNFFGSDCNGIKFVRSNNRPLMDCEYIRVGDDCSNVTIKANNLSIAPSTPLKNIKIGSGIKNKTVEISDQSLVNADFEINIVAAENVNIVV